MATKRTEVYECSVCGNMVEVVHAAGGTLSCCGKPMVLQSENTTDAAQEKHVPVIGKGGGGVKVKVGSVAHPMEAEHWIEWIEVLQGDKVYREYLNPGDAPEAVFPVSGDVTAREYCNMHGLWKA